MDSIKNEKSRAAIYAWSVSSIVLFACWLLYSEKIPDHVSALIPACVLTQGIQTMGLSLAVTVFFMDHANKKYFCTQFFSKAMYTAYIIQFVFPMIVASKCLFLILESTGNIAYNGTPSLDTAYIVNDNLIFPGWLLVATITLLIIWPLAYAIRSIPGFSQIL